LTVFERVIEFFKEKIIQIPLSPEIVVDYHSYDADKEAKLTQQWEKLLKQLDEHPEIVLSRKKNEWCESRGREEIRVEIEGVPMIMKGPYYQIESAPKRERYLSDEERATTDLDNVMRNSSLVWSLQHAKRATVNSFLQVVNASAGEPDRTIVEKAADEVIRRLQIRTLLSP